ncbi:MAG: MFS transporter [Pseudohongiellaceae bacterium]
MSSTPTPGVYYGWKIVAAILVMLTFVTGLSFYNHAVILNALARLPAFTVQSASAAVSLFFLSAGVAGVGVAKWIQRTDVRVCISFGALISCLSLSLLAWVETVWQLYAVYMLFGVGFAASNLIPATTLVTRWFQRKRAMALAVASTGLSLGGVVITPVCALMVESIGLQRAAPIMGLLYLLGVIPVAWIWLRPSPESIGLQIDGGKAEEIVDVALPASVVSPLKVQHGVGDGITFREAWHGRFFWCLGLSYILLMLAQVGGISHQYGLARELLNDAQTALVVAILPVGSIVGRLAGGWIVEQVSTRVFATIMMILQVVSLALLALGLGVAGLCIGLALFGITVGNLLMLQPLLVAEAYGVRDYARIFSMNNLMSSWGTASGPVLLGAVYAAGNNQYGAAYFLAAAAGFLGLLLFALGGPVRQHGSRSGS